MVLHKQISVSLEENKEGSERDNLQCDQCMCKALNKIDLVMHVESSNLFKCIHCEFKTEEVSNLTSHMQIHE